MLCRDPKRRTTTPFFTYNSSPIFLLYSAASEYSFPLSPAQIPVRFTQIALRRARVALRLSSWPRVGPSIVSQPSTSHPQPQQSLPSSQSPQISFPFPQFSYPPSSPPHQTTAEHLGPSHPFRKPSPHPRHLSFHLLPLLWLL